MPSQVGGGYLCPYAYADGWWMPVCLCRWVVDATHQGGAARFINHSCDPNCVTKIVAVDGHKHICIYSKRRIEQGEELCYDYKVGWNLRRVCMRARLNMVFVPIFPGRFLLSMCVL